MVDTTDAIGRLRRFLLAVAVRGKLSNQLPSDEPASQLVEELMAARRSRKLGHLPRALTEAEKPFALPSSWEWIRLGEAFEYDAGDKRDPSRLDPDMWLVELEDIESDSARIVAHLKVKDRNSRSAKSEFRSGDVLYGKLRPYLNKVVVASEPGYSTTEIVAIRPFVPMSPEYICLALRRPDFVDYVTKLGRGTKMPRLRTEDAWSAPFPLPPIAEQGRIVAKVDELTALCDRLEATQKEREVRRDALRAASLHRLTASEGDAKPSSADVRFFLDTSPRLITKPEHVGSLRETILDLAVRGRLVLQDAMDEPAGELFRRIANDRKASVANGVLKPITHTPDRVTTNWAVPPSWLTVPLASAVYFQEGPGLRNWQFRPSGIPFLNIRTLQDGKVNRALCQFLDPAEVENKYSHFLVRAGDILCSTSGTIGKLAVAEADDLPLMLNTSIVRFAPYGTSGPDRRFIRLYLGTRLFLDQANRSTTGSAQVNMGPRQLKEMAFPLPPLAEQHRIVARVDELMALCDQLEAALAAAQDGRARMLEALLHQALQDSALPKLIGTAMAV